MSNSWELLRSALAEAKDIQTAADNNATQIARVLDGRYNEEDSDMHRQIYRMQSDHKSALQREEEKGYAKGLLDAAATQPPVSAAALALEALKPLAAMLTPDTKYTVSDDYTIFNTNGAVLTRGDMKRAIAAIAALEAEAVQEPVAWMTADGRVSNRETVETAMPNASRENFNIPLYATPQQPAPEIDRLRAINAEMLSALGRIADSSAIGARARQMSNSMRNLFMSFEEAARDAIKKATP